MLPNQKVLQVTLVYRSPSVSMNVLLNVLPHIISQISSNNCPSVVLGDFNVDLATQIDSPLIRLMCDHGYSQLIHTPTTDNGSLLDHVYHNRPCDPSLISVIDTYYSDHDMVCLSLPT